MIFKSFIGEVNIAPYLETGKIETVLSGSENYLGCRPLHHDWVQKAQDACSQYGVQHIFGQPDILYIKDGKEYKIRNRTEQMLKHQFMYKRFPSQR